MLFAPEIDNTFFKRLLSNKTLSVVRTIYRPPNQSNPLKCVNTYLNKHDTGNNEIYVFGDLNFTLNLNN